MKLDEYGVVVNSQSTIDDMAAFLLIDMPVVFAWSDQAGTQLDILMVYMPMQFGNLQRGMNSSTDLFVAVSGCGMFGFELNGAWKSPEYVGEKLGLGVHNGITIALAELINGVCRVLEGSK